MGYFDEEPYEPYEPSEYDIVMSEFGEKMKEALKAEVKDHYERIESENARLKAENNKLREKEREVNRKETDLKYKEENLKREVINEFYRSNIGDTLKEYLDTCEVWFAGISRYQGEKCNLCNDEREMIAKFPNGKITTVKCDCAKTLSTFIPELSAIEMIRFCKRDSRYSSSRSFYLSKIYSPSKKSDYDYDYQEFKIYHVIDNFDDSIIELHENKKYGERLGFKNKEECQKYCDWLNKKEK
jgi:regulator of replication initiation timing